MYQYTDTGTSYFDFQILVLILLISGVNRHIKYYDSISDNNSYVYLS